MREVLSGWFGPVVDSGGRRVRFRASRPALALCAASQVCYGATILLGMLMLTDLVKAPWWAATLIAATVLGVAARARLRRAVRT